MDVIVRLDIKGFFASIDIREGYDHVTGHVRNRTSDLATPRTPAVETRRYGLSPIPSPHPCRSRVAPHSYPMFGSHSG